MVQFLIGLKYKSSLDHFLVTAVASLPLGHEFSGFVRRDFSITAVFQVAGAVSNSKRAPSLQEQHNFIQLQLKARCHKWSNLFILTGNRLELQERKSHQHFPCESQSLFFPVVSGVCYVDIKLWGMREDTHDFRDSSSPQFTYNLHE